VEHVCRAAAAALGVDGAAVWLATRVDRRALLYASNQVAAGLDEHHFTLGEGPCLDAWDGRAPVLVPDLSSGEALARWPVFAPAATATGARALFAFPLQAGAIRLGGLDLYRAKAGPLTSEELADALTFAYAALAVMLAASSPAGVQESWPLVGMGGERAEVYQATGMIAVQLGVGLAEALVRLRALAFSEGVGVAQVAHRVVDRSLRFGPDGITRPD
jgi:hypothetical protein